MTTRSGLPRRVTVSIMWSIEGRRSQDSHGLSVSSGVAACVSSNLTRKPYYYTVTPASLVHWQWPASPTILSPLYSALEVPLYCNYIVNPASQCTSGDPSPTAPLVPCDASQAETTNDEDSFGIASHQLLYITCTNIFGQGFTRAQWSRLPKHRLGVWGINLIPWNENVDAAFSHFANQQEFSINSCAPLLLHFLFRLICFPQ